LQVEGVDSAVQKGDQKMNRLLFLGLVGLVLVCLLCLYCHAPAIEEELRGKALACVEDAGLDSELLAVSGRDVTLAGAVGSQVLVDNVEACLAAIPGMRVVNTRLEIGSNAAPEAQPVNRRTELHALKEN
jgi:hypothetical protein